MCFIIHLFIFAYVRSSSRRVHAQVFSIQRNLAGDRRRDFGVLRQAIVFYCTFVVGCSPIALLNATDDNHRAAPAVYSFLQILANISFFIIVNFLILTNNDVKDYLWQKIQLRFQR